MKAMMLTGIRRMEMREVPDPKIEKPDDVLLRLAAVGVCGSDVHYYETGRIGSQVVQFPFTVGHECAAVVEAVGPAVKRVKPGDRVVVEPAVSCGECDQCRAGRPHTCRHLLFLGCPGQISGCFSEKLVMPEECCLHMPDGMSFELGALCEPLAIGHYAAKLAGNLDGASVAILGSGPIGLSVLVMALAQGVESVFMTDKIDARLAMADLAGASWTGNPLELDIVESILGTEPLGVDVVFECAGQQETIDQAMHILKPGGKLMLIGIPREDRISIPIDFARRKEICIQNVRRQNGSTEHTIEMVAEGLPVEFMITHRFRFEEAQKAMALIAGYEDGAIKAMVLFDA
jgi:L-iditol 2-dehydrogenase